MILSLLILGGGFSESAWRFRSSINAWFKITFMLAKFLFLDFLVKFHLTTTNSNFSLRVTTSIYPVPSICAQDQVNSEFVLFFQTSKFNAQFQISDWFASLAECLHWNVRKKQKHFDELSDLTR